MATYPIAVARLLEMFDRELVDMGIEPHELERRDYTELFWTYLRTLVDDEIIGQDTDGRYYYSEEFVHKSASLDIARCGLRF